MNKLMEIKQSFSRMEYVNGQLSSYEIVQLKDVSINLHNFMKNVYTSYKKEQLPDNIYHSLNRIKLSNDKDEIIKILNKQFETLFKLKKYFDKKRF